MKPGHELDAKIAAEVMKWEIKPYNWAPSTRIKDAFEVLQKMEEGAEKDGIKLMESTRADSLPYAICLAALGMEAEIDQDENLDQRK